ncbi:hypothetical protein [Ruegeria atlantica]|jgi:aspartate aminotransferase-like enzyme|nr:hypothetical protein [Ruegeria atlantica]
MPVAVVHALDVALDDMLKEGLYTRYARHAEARDFYRDGQAEVSK